MNTAELPKIKKLAKFTKDLQDIFLNSIPEITTDDEEVIKIFGSVGVRGKWFHSKIKKLYK